MKVRVVRSTTQCDTFYTLIPLNFALKLFSLNCVYRDGTALKFFWSLPKVFFRILLLGAIYVFNLYNRLFIWKSSISLQFKDFIQVVFFCGYFQYLIDLFFVYKYGRRDTLNYYTYYENIDRVLGVKEYKEIRRSINILCFFFGFVTFITSAVDFAAWFISYGTIVIVTYIIDYFNVIIRHLSFADVIAQVTQVSFRLRFIGDLLKGFYLLSETLPDGNDLILDKDKERKGWTNTGSNELRPLERIDHYESVMAKLNGCYLMLLEQNDYINALYGVRILLMCLSSLIDTVMTLNLVLRIIMGSVVTTYSSGIFPVITSLVRILSVAFVLLYEVYRCEKCYYQLNRIIRYIDYLLVNKKISLHTRESLTSLRSLVISRPVLFHALSFFKLDCALLLSIGSAVITYTMILLQNVQ